MGKYNQIIIAQQKFDTKLSETVSELDRLMLIIGFCQDNYNTIHKDSCKYALEGLKICSIHELPAETAILNTYIAFYQWHTKAVLNLNNLVQTTIPELLKNRLYREFGLTILMLGLIEWAKGNHENAFNIINKALDDIKYKKNKNYALVRLHWALGVFYFDLDEIEQSRHYFNRSSSYINNETDLSLISYVKLGLAGIYKKQSRIQKATKLVNEVLEISIKGNNWMTEAQAYLELGALQLLIGNKLKAYELINESYIIRKRNNAEPAMVTSLITLAEISLDVADYNDAEDLLQKSIIISTQRNLKPKLAKAYLLLSKIEEAKKNFELSYNYLKKNQALESEIRNLEKTDRNKFLQLNYKAKKAQKESLSQKLINSKLEESLTKEKELNELKSHFVATASHQFRTPLAIIKSNTELFKLITKNSDLKLRPELDKASVRIEKEIERMVNLMDEILILGKINAGRSMDLDLEATDIIAFCHEITYRFNNLLKGEKKISFNYSGKAQKIIIDKTLISHALHNLISNAIKYSPDGNVLFDVLFVDKTIIIKITDKGIGIPKQEIPDLFQPFHRATNVGNISGTGLGLVIVKEYIELHGGKIAVKSVLNKGTEFTIILPNKPRH
jgi:signal transduction histidine kinase